MDDQSRPNKALTENIKLRAKIARLEKQLEQQGDENRILVRMCNKMSQELGLLKCTRTVGEVVV